MAKQLGQPVVVDNKAGASGNIGATFVAKSAPDGYTLLVGYSMFHVGNPSMFKDLAWDPIRDFSSVAMVAVSPHVIAVHPSVPARTLQELVDLAKKEPGKLNYASPGSGSVPHVGMELFKQQAGIDVMHVPYKGAGPMMQDVIAGQVQMTVATPPSLLGFVQAGRVRALAVAAKTRHPVASRCADHRRSRISRRSCWRRGSRSSRQRERRALSSRSSLLPRPKR
jgi:tripartite-type tricarboxylate transporter receptor subunit TctC